MQAQPMPMPMAPATRKTNPIVWILVAVVGLFVLGFLAVVGTTLFIARTVARNPAAAAARLAALANKNMDVVSEDDHAGTITLRDRRTGKTVTMTFDQARGGKFSVSAEGDDGKVATMEFGSGNSKLPSWVPSYPGSSPQFNITARGQDNDSSGEGGNFSFTTSDPASQVMKFYEDKARDLGMTVKLNTTTTNAGMVIATDEANERTLSAIVGSEGGNTTVNVTYGAKRR